LPPWGDADSSSIVIVEDEEYEGNGILDITRNADGKLEVTG